MAVYTVFTNTANTLGNHNLDVSMAFIHVCMVMIKQYSTDFKLLKVK